MTDLKNIIELLQKYGEFTVYADFDEICFSPVQKNIEYSQEDIEILNDVFSVTINEFNDIILYC